MPDIPNDYVPAPTASVEETQSRVADRLAWVNNVPSRGQTPPARPHLFAKTLALFRRHPRYAVTYGLVALSVFAAQNGVSPFEVDRSACTTPDFSAQVGNPTLDSTVREAPKTFASGFKDFVTTASDWLGGECKQTKSSDGLGL